MSHAVGSAVTDGYDAAAQLTSSKLTTTAGWVSLASLSYTRDAVGDVTTSTGTGATAGTTSYAYDALDQLDSTTTTVAGSPVTSDYGVDNSTGDVTTLAGQAQTFSNGRKLLTSATTGTGTTAYTYNNDGARITSAYTPTGGTSATATSTLSYRQAGTLSKYTTTSAPTTTSTTYAYDGDNLRVSKSTTGGGTTGFVWQTANTDTPQLLVDGATDYIWDPTGQPIAQVNTSTGATDYFFHDQVGSTRVLTDATGDCTGTYSYTPYGVATHTGTESTHLTFTGGYADTESGLIYLVNRYYDPTTGVFTTIDPAVAVTGDPYTYTNGNPINQTDPLGLFSWRKVGEYAAIGVGIVAGAAAGCAFTGCAADVLALAGGGGFVISVTGAGGAAAGAAAGGGAVALAEAHGNRSSGTSGGNNDDEGDDDSTCPGTAKRPANRMNAAIRRAKHHEALSELTLEKFTESRITFTSMTDRL